MKDLIPKVDYVTGYEMDPPKKKEESPKKVATKQKTTSGDGGGSTKKPRARKSDTQNGSNLLLCKFAKHENYEKNITPSVTTLATKIALYSEHLNQGITKLIKLFTDQYTVDSEAYEPNGKEEHTAVGDREDETFIFPDKHAQLFIFQLFASQPCRATTYLLHSKTIQVYVIVTHNIVEQLHTSSSAKPLKYLIHFIDQVIFITHSFQSCCPLWSISDRCSNIECCTSVGYLQ